MKLYLDCYPCIINMALNSAQLLTLNKNQTKSLVDKTVKLLHSNEKNLNAPQLVAEINKIIIKNYFKGRKTIDPYKQIKQKTNQLALSFSNKLYGLLGNSKNRLEMALKIAAAGNIIDFGAKDYRSVDIEHEIDNIGNLTFGIFDFKKLTNRLKKAKSLLYIGDNAGEIVFDRILIEELKKVYHDLDITFAVRGEPILNDATLEDAKMVGMNDIARVIPSGSKYPATILEETTEPFKENFKSADVIIVKGQGNFETLSSVDKNNLFFILRVKCDLIARHVGTEVESLVLWNIR